MSLPISVIVTVKNESARIVRCLEALRAFDEVVVVDSNSTDGTPDLARQAGATVVSYMWNGRYPKKRQWCLDHLTLQHNWIFFVDADEIVTEDMVAELHALFEKGPACDGYFVKGRYVIDKRVLCHGLVNNKLALFERTRFVFPVVDDLDLPGMGAKPDRKDVFVEIDYMVGSDHTHKPMDAAIARIVKAFADAPVSNPDGTTGIALHVLVDEALPHQTELGTLKSATSYDWTAFDANNDGVVDFNDIVAVLGSWLTDYTGDPGATGFGDANFDGVVDFNDIVTILGNWLVNCA